jgi:outer membrane protein TolC
VTQDYLEYMLQNQIVAAAKDNVSFQSTMVGDINESIKGGALTDADRLQGSERLQAAKARLREALEELEATKIRFIKAVGEPIVNPDTPPSVAKYIPKTLDDALFIANKNSPRIYSANADIDAADAGVRGARANYLPKVNLEGTARVGDDIDGDEGNTNDYQVRVVARWNLYRGGIDVAREQEQIRRSGEQRYALAQVQREVRNRCSSAWNERASRGELSGILGKQVVDQQPARRLLSRAVQGRPAFAARRARCAEHPLQHQGSRGHGARRLPVCRVQDPGRFRQSASDDEAEAGRAGQGVRAPGVCCPRERSRIPDMSSSTLIRRPACRWIS